MSSLLLAQLMPIQCDVLTPELCEQAQTIELTLSTDTARLVATLAKTILFHMSCLLFITLTLLKF